MGPNWLLGTAVAAVTFVAMELVAAGVHRFIMHGPGWGWHRSHHERRTGWFELNDLYALVFASLSFGLFVAAARVPLLWWVGLGMALYGVGYALLHDGLVHRRFPVSVPANNYLKRLIQAHRLHHAVHERDGAVSFGFLYARPVQELRAKLRARLAGE